MKFDIMQACVLCVNPSCYAQPVNMETPTMCTIVLFGRREARQRSTAICFVMFEIMVRCKQQLRTIIQKHMESPPLYEQSLNMTTMLRCRQELSDTMREQVNKTSHLKKYCWMR